jgi:hypothetical protein
MSGIVLLILRFLLAVALYAFLGWTLVTLWRDLKHQRELILARQPIPLTLAAEGAAPQRFTTPEVLVGRDPTCDFPLDDPAVSIQHARLSYHHNQWWVDDLRSTNGTFLNDEPVMTPVVVTNSDELRCGGVLLKIGVGETRERWAKPG